MAAAVTPAATDDLTAELNAARRLAVREPAQALARLSGLLERFPASGRLYQALGQLHQALGDRAAALSAYRTAVHFNDALEDSWLALESLYRAAGQAREAAEAARCGAHLRALPPQILRAAFALNEGEHHVSEQQLREYLRVHGAHPDGMRLLAQICVKANVLDDAELLLENVLALRPEDDAARFEYVSVLVQRRRYQPALHALRPLLARAPGDPRYRRLYAAISDGLGASAEALRVYRELQAEAPDDPALPLATAHILKVTGAAEHAQSIFIQALESPASFSEACLALSHLKDFRFSEQQLAQMRSREASAGITRADRYRLCFALGRTLEQAGQYADSFAYYARGNALKRAEITVDPEIFIRTMRRQRQVCTAELFAARCGFGCASPDPIFIVGMPRAGSTLIEQILASHSQIDGTLELPDIPRLVHQFRNRSDAEPPRYPAILAELTPEECRQLGESYLEETRVHRRGAPFFLDKMPNNFRDLGFIHLILPNARILDVRREALACCFGNFKQLFPQGMEFKYSLEELGRYYCQYVALMEHWQQVLPGKILRVNYEDVVGDLEGSVRRTLDFLGLPFEQSCLEFYRTQRTVRTLSSDQVRRPINREGLEQWRHFEPWLAPLKSALAPLRASAELVQACHAGIAVRAE
jgi:tetratricopeptide (TPR) repeat protein